MFDVKRLLDDIAGEVNKEAVDAAKAKLKAKAKAVAAAKQVVANLEREWEALVLEVQADLG